MILDEIVAFKKQELKLTPRIAIAKLEQAIGQLPVPRDFAHAIRKNGNQLKLIAEVKQASPSKGVLAANFCPETIARGYTKGGASAISVLTERKYFLGSVDNLQKVKCTTHLPVLRKDFIIEPYQIMESRAIGADAVLLIAAILTKKELVYFIKLAEELGVAPLVEVHQRRELELVLETEANIIGINNRNLQTFAVDLDTTFTLLSLIPSGKIVVSESGITAENITSLKNSPVDAVLVGESLIRQSNSDQAVSELLA
ncbi:MAG: indole-3-glycerol phosphate synthase TrpC [Clostridia bacterium]|jgi:indole-3-glycerol phosphate synthase|nr:indole-3-glycerol phosphate synthase TrpC [Clostridia bacterium]